MPLETTKRNLDPKTIHTAGDGGLDTEKDIVDVGTHRVDLTRRITHIHRRHQHQLLLCLVLHQGQTVSSGQMSGQNLLISSVQKVRHLRMRIRVRSSPFAVRMVSNPFSKITRK